MSKQTMTKSQLREAINGLGPLAPDWLVEALEDFIELQEAHKNLLAIHAEDAYHLDEARAKLQAPAIDERAEFEKWYEADALPCEYGMFRRDRHDNNEYDSVEEQKAWRCWQAARKLSAPVVPDAKDELDHDGIWTNSDVAEQRYIQGWNDCRAAMLKGEK